MSTYQIYQILMQLDDLYRVQLLRRKAALSDLPGSMGLCLWQPRGSWARPWSWVLRFIGVGWGMVTLGAAKKLVDVQVWKDKMIADVPG
jgi:hypothetical protein